jgi:hypothetical protein
MGLDRYRPEGQPQQKIRPGHLDRAAVVYVRQSSRQQVLEHSESTRLQYALAGRAVALGWARSQVVVIDDDLGVSAATADSRKGFARLVTEVTMGRAGIVLGIEMSRLARTGRDWHQLLGAPRGAVYSCGDGRAPPPGRRSGLVKLEAARSGDRRGGREQPRQRRDGSVLPDGPGPASKVRRRNASEPVVEAP